MEPAAATARSAAACALANIGSNSCKPGSGGAGTTAGASKKSGGGYGGGPGGGGPSGVSPGCGGPGVAMGLARAGLA